MITEIPLKYGPVFLLSLLLSSGLFALPATSQSEGLTTLDEDVSPSPPSRTDLENMTHFFNVRGVSVVGINRAKIADVCQLNLMLIGQKGTTYLDIEPSENTIDLCQLLAAARPIDTPAESKLDLLTFSPDEHPDDAPNQPGTLTTVDQSIHYNFSQLQEFGWNFSSISGLVNFLSYWPGTGLPMAAITELLNQTFQCPDILNAVEQVNYHQAGTCSVILSHPENAHEGSVKFSITVLDDSLPLMHSIEPRTKNDKQYEWLYAKTDSYGGNKQVSFNGKQFIGVAMLRWIQHPQQSMRERQERVRQRRQERDLQRGATALGEVVSELWSELWGEESSGDEQPVRNNNEPRNQRQQSVQQQQIAPQPDETVRQRSGASKGTSANAHDNAQPPTYSTRQTGSPLPQTAEVQSSSTTVEPGCCWRCGDCIYSLGKYAATFVAGYVFGTASNNQNKPKSKPSRNSGK